MEKENELILPALRAQMGDWIYYLAFMRVEAIAQRIQMPQEVESRLNLKNLIAPQIKDKADDISEYLLTQPERFLNTLVVGVYGGAPNWYELAIGTNPQFDAESLPGYLDGALGILRLDGTETLFAIDGQHRVEGIKQALKKNEDLKTDEVSVIFVAHRNDSSGVERTLKLFTTLNRSEKEVNDGLSA